LIVIWRILVFIDLEEYNEIAINMAEVIDLFKDYFVSDGDKA